jgi:hypothetical protein
MKKRINSKQKGNRGEREWAKICREHGYEESKRSQQYCGGTTESADVTGLPYIHQEVKFGYDMTVEQLRDFLCQAIQDASKSRKEYETLIPVVAHKKTYGKWFVTMETSDFAYMFDIAFEDINALPKISTTMYVTYVTLPVEDWFVIYKEFEASLSINREVS